VRIAYTAGFRAALATIGPLVVGAALGGEVATWASIAGFDAVLVDRGGSYRFRARVQALTIVALAAVVALGSVVARDLALALPAMFVVAVAGGLARSWGAPGASIGTITAIGFVIALGIPSGAGEAPLRALAVFGGGAWAMVVTLGVWPLRPYRPLRRAVAACYRALAAYADEANTRSGEWQPGGATFAMRAALEEARAVLGSMRRIRTGDSPRGERLLVLHVLADQLFAHAIALADANDMSRDRSGGAVMVRLAATARAIADAIEIEEGAPEIAVAWSGADVKDPHVAAIVDRLAHFARIAATTAVALDDRPLARLDGVDVERPLPPSMRLSALLAPSSVIRRHALRAGVLATFSVALVAALDLARGYWVTITVIGILQPYTGATTARAIERVAGTVIGGALTAALAALFHTELAILVLATVSVSICIAVLPVSYAAFSAFVTPTFVLLAELHADDWSLVHVRIGATLLGGAVALLGVRLLWPQREATRLPAALAAALDADREYLRHAIALAGGDPSTNAAPARAARRAFGVAAGNADESFQRLLGEHRGGEEELAPRMTVLTYARRLVATGAALAQLRHVPGAIASSLDPLARSVDAILVDLTDASRESRAPSPLPSFDALLAPLDGAAKQRAERLLGQLAAIHAALAQAAMQPRSTETREPSVIPSVEMSHR
jgi:uncharacterized membrane protein YccC